MHVDSRAADQPAPDSHATPAVRAACRFVTAIHVLLAAGFATATFYRMRSPSGVIDSDFTVFRSAWWLILHGRGGALYDASAQASTQRYLMGGRAFQGGLMAFLNPPHAALAGVPLGWLADRFGGGLPFALWAAANVVMLLRLDYLVRARLRADRGEARWTITFAILAFYPVLYTIAIGQLSLLLAVAAFELLRALEAGRTRAAVGWLIVLTIKPQLLPALVLLLAVRSCWRILASAAGAALAIGVATMIVLGPTIWLSYATNLHGLERYFAAGTPAYMMNLRGALTRLVPGGSADALYVASLAIWVVAMASLWLFLVRGRQANGSDWSSDFALTLALGLFFNPHLFPQDTVIWIVALVCFTGNDRLPVPFAAFVLCWPVIFALARALDAARPSTLHLSPVSVVMTIAIVVMVGERLTGRGRELDGVRRITRSSAVMPS